MNEELARLVIGLPVAALFPWGIPALRERRFGGLVLSVAYAAVVLAPVLSDWQGWVLLIVTPAIALVAMRLAWRPTREAHHGPTPHVPAGGLRKETIDSIALMGLAVGCALVAALVAGAGDAADAVGDVLMDDGVCVVVSGLLAAVFVAGLFLVAILGPFTRSSHTRTG